MFGPTKTYQTRSVPLPRFLCEEIGPMLAGKDRDDFVFPGPEGGPMRHGNFYARHFKPAVVQGGLPPGVRVHDLRHTHAGFLIADGTHPRAIMERMGHSSITVTLNTYGHICPASNSASPALSTLGGARPKSRPDPLGHVWVMKWSSISRPARRQNP